VYGPTTAATEEEMERFYQDLSQAVKHVPKGDMLLVMGDFIAKVGRREPSAMSSAVGLFGLGEKNKAIEQLEHFCLEHELDMANNMFNKHPRRLYTWTCPDGDAGNQIDHISIVQRWKTSLMNCRTNPGANYDAHHQLLVAMLKVRLAKRQRQHSIPSLNLEEVKEEKAVQFAAEVTNRFTALEAEQHEVNPKDLEKYQDSPAGSSQYNCGSTGSINRKRNRNGYLMRLTQQSGKRQKKTKIRTDIKN